MLEFLKSLAFEGETLLIVQQKPILVNGELEYYDTGAPKAVWPAYLPDRKLTPDKAWYANTGSFILKRMSGKMSASAANCTHCLFLGLDDVGTKSKYPPLPPTWIIETSPSNFQWGYAYGDEQATCGEQEAALKAIAAAGYTDPGACNAVRNLRLPGSVNLKQGRDRFPARLVEFHPERLFTLPQICAALGVAPGEASTARAALTLPDDGGDEVLAWLSKAGHLLAKVNSAGWAGIACPRADRHTDGNPEARYMPSTRAFTCLHEHCTDLDTEWFLDWVYERGGPNVNAGLRSDLLAATMGAALAKLAPTKMYPDAAARIVAEVDRKEMGRIEMEALHDHWAYVVANDSYFHLTERRELGRAQFNAIYRHLDCRRGNRRVEAGMWFDEHRQARGGRELVGVTYAAGDSILCSLGGDVYGNMWRNARPGTTPGDVALWTEHCRRLVPEPFELDHIWDCMAYKLQHPHAKINHAILHAGFTRCGKDTMWAPFFWSIRGESDRNVALVSSETLGSQWGYDLLSEVLVINELRQTQSADRRALENKLKPIIAAPPEFLPVNRKGMHPVNVVNRVFVMAFSNARDAIALPSDDGRWFVVWSDVGAMAEADARKIWKWYLTAGGFAAVGAWLMARDVSKFNPAAHPPMTEAKAVLCEQSMSAPESWILEEIRHAPEFALGAIGGPFHSLIDVLQGRCPPGVKLYQGALFHALAEAGWRDLGRVMSSKHTNRRRAFVRPDMLLYSRAEIRDMIEPARAPALKLVEKEKAPESA